MLLNPNLPLKAAVNALSSEYGTTAYRLNVQRSAKRLVRGCERFVPALAYLFCLTLTGACLARFAYLLADLCMCQRLLRMDTIMLC